MTWTDRHPLTGALTASCGTAFFLKFTSFCLFLPYSRSKISFICMQYAPGTRLYRGAETSRLAAAFSRSSPAFFSFFFSVCFIYTFMYIHILPCTAFHHLSLSVLHFSLYIWHLSRRLFVEILKASASLFPLRLWNSWRHSIMKIFHWLLPTNTMYIIYIHTIFYIYTYHAGINAHMEWLEEELDEAF